MVDFEFAASLSREQAKELLDEFLQKGKTVVQQLVAIAAVDGLAADFSTASLIPLLRWGYTKVRFVPLPHDPNVPTWIREWEDYEQHHITFDEGSKDSALTLAYYLGETFVRNFSVLSWATGDRETILDNMPVVAGFKFEKEMAPIMIVENMYAGIKAGGSFDDIDRAIEAWLSFVPE